MTQHYIGVKQCTAKPMTLGEYNEYRMWTIPSDEDPSRPGYLVFYPGGYTTWSPKEEFDCSHLPMGESNDGSKITLEMVDAFIAGDEAHTMGRKTTALVTRLSNNFELVESSSCVDPANYDFELGTRLCRQRARDQVWKLLGFLLQCARNGFAAKAE